jgi:hypothetical protein
MSIGLKKKIEDCGVRSWRIIYAYIGINIFITMLALFADIYFQAIDLSCCIDSISRISAYFELFEIVNRKKMVVYVYSMQWITYFAALIFIVLHYKNEITKSDLQNLEKSFPRTLGAFITYVFFPLLGTIIFSKMTFCFAFYDIYSFERSSMLFANKVHYSDWYLLKPIVMLFMNLFFFTLLIAGFYHVKNIKKK